MGLEDALHTQRRAIRSCDLLILNTEEALLISEESTVVAAAVRLGSWGPHTVVVTGGGDRPALVWERGQTWEVVPFPVDVRYDVNAGDTFHAGFLSAHVRGIAAAGAGQFAAAAAAIKISRIPLLTNLPTWDEVERFLVGARPPEPCRPGSAGRR
jgi:sugar/nucleoside kinase (ribokinase family)